MSSLSQTDNDNTVSDRSTSTKSNVPYHSFGITNNDFAASPYHHCTFRYYMKKLVSYYVQQKKEYNDKNLLFHYPNEAVYQNIGNFF